MYCSSENGTENRTGENIDSNGNAHTNKKDIDHEPTNLTSTDEVVNENVVADENNGESEAGSKSESKRRSKTKSPSNRRRSRSKDKGEKKRRSRYNY